MEQLLSALIREISGDHGRRGRIAWFIKSINPEKLMNMRILKAKEATINTRFFRFSSA